MSHRRRVALATVRQVRAVARCARLAATLERLTRQAAAQAFAALPADPARAHPHHAAVQVRAAIAALGPRLAAALRAGLAAIAGWGHAASARLLTADVRRREAVTRVLEDDDRDEYARDEYARWVIPPPPVELIRLIVGSAPDRLTTLAPAQRVADLVAAGISAGRDRRAIAADLEPVLAGVAAAARRVARTEGLRVATSAQVAASEQIPELIAGYQVCAVLDDRTRPEHRRRHGTTYYRRPKPGQLGFDAMPHPPVEADGRLAWNCRCTLVPVFADEPVPSPVPDPDVMGEWYERATPSEQETLVGAERYALGQRRRRPPTWRDFLDERDELLPVEALRSLWQALVG